MSCLLAVELFFTYPCVMLPVFSQCDQIWKQVVGDFAQPRFYRKTALRYAQVPLEEVGLNA